MISYEPLFKTMREKNVSSYELAKRGFPRSTYYSIKRGNSITTNTVCQLCSILQCGVSDIIEYVYDPEEEDAGKPGAVEKIKKAQTITDNNKREQF